MAYISYPYNYISNFRNQNVSACVPQETYIRDVRLAASYVPYQKFCTMLSPLEALMKGTAFPELFSPYEGKNKQVSPLEGIKREDEQ